MVDPPPIPTVKRNVGRQARTVARVNASLASVGAVRHSKTKTPASVCQECLFVFLLSLICRGGVQTFPDTYHGVVANGMARLFLSDAMHEITSMME